MHGYHVGRQQQEVGMCSMIELCTGPRYSDSISNAIYPLHVCKDAVEKAGASLIVHLCPDRC